MTNLKKLLEPGFIGKVRIQNRVSMAPMERCIGDLHAVDRWASIVARPRGNAWRRTDRFRMTAICRMAALDTTQQPE